MTAERIYTQTFGCVGAIIEKDGKILLVKEAAKVDKGQWNQPAGWIDVGEDPILAVKREIKEETGLDFEPTGFLGVYSMRKKYLSAPHESRHPIKLLFCGNITGGELIQGSREIAELQWFSPEEIYNMDAPPLRDKDIKDAVKNYFDGKIYPLDLVKHTEMEMK